MSEPTVEGLYRSTVEVTVEGDHLEVFCGAAGPAGSSLAEFADGGLWEVDHARPHVPVALHVDTNGLEPPPLLVEAFGSATTAEIMAVVPADVPAGEPGWLTRIEPPQGSRSAAGAPIGPDEPAAVIGRLVLLADLSSDPALHPLARLAAAAEFVVMADQTPLGYLFDDARRRVTERIAGLLDEIHEDDLDSLDRDVISRLAVLCRAAADVGEGSVGPFAELYDWLDTTRDDLVAGAMVSPLLAAEVDAISARELRRAARAVTSDFGEVPPPVGRAHIDITRVTPTLLRVTTSLNDEPCWIRVFDRDGLVPVAQAPLLQHDLVEVAEVVVPPDLDDSDLEVTVVVADELEVAPERPLALIRRAVEVGRDAARATRLGDRNAASRLWLRCGELWGQLGDDDRAAVARSLAQPPDIAPVVQPFLADEIAMVLSDG